MSGWWCLTTVNIPLIWKWGSSSHPSSSGPWSVSVSPVASSVGASPRANRALHTTFDRQEDRAPDSTGLCSRIVFTTSENRVLDVPSSSFKPTGDCRTFEARPKNQILGLKLQNNILVGVEQEKSMMPNGEEIERIRNVFGTTASTSDHDIKDRIDNLDGAGGTLEAQKQLLEVVHRGYKYSGNWQLQVNERQGTARFTRKQQVSGESRISNDK